MLHEFEPDALAAHQITARLESWNHWKKHHRRHRIRAGRTGNVSIGCRGGFTPPLDEQLAAWSWRRKAASTSTVLTQSTRRRSTWRLKKGLLGRAVSGAWRRRSARFPALPQPRWVTWGAT